MSIKEINNYKLLIVLSCLCLAQLVTHGQRNRYSKKKLANLSTFDDKWIHFGFSLGINSADFFLDPDLSKNDSLLRLEVDPQLGFNLGIVSDLHVGNNINLRFIPALSFSQRNLEYTFRQYNGEEKKKFVKPVESTYLDFPLNVKFRSNRDGNFAAYVVGGFMYSLDLVSQEKVENVSSNPDNIVIKLKKHTYSYQVGFGFDFFLQYFKFSPEFKLSGGLDNIMIQDQSLFSNPIERIRSRIFLVSFTFEG